MRKSYFEPAAEFFDRSSVPKEIADLWDEWRELDPDTARLVRAAVSSRSPRQLRNYVAAATSQGWPAAASQHTPISILSV